MPTNTTLALGQVVITAGALTKVEFLDLLRGLVRHAACDWGDVDEEDKASNDLSLREGTRILSAYYSKSRIRFWIITEWDRSATTVLLPEEY